ncbi:hypothetical protein [Winogradskya humida]|uniref:DUF2335 domain-containing protein n=1 Tax=Winogradskya humida TaxID=113566 RepID=A0ABQ3ZL67_9ACTN|nr:hypothetical protein [Actinoplanes humidus]GIE18937.1 hypothetical protein Ahu01nite_020390 [Actinoplanes humidus]
MTSSWSTLDPWDKAAQWAQTAPELAADVIFMAKDYAEFRKQEERRESEHRRDMDRRIWWTQAAAVVTNCLCLVALVVLALTLHSDDVVPALVVAGAGAVLSLISVIAGVSMRRSFRGRA